MVAASSGPILPVPVGIDISLRIDHRDLVGGKVYVWESGLSCNLRNLSG